MEINVLIDDDFQSYLDTGWLQDIIKQVLAIQDTPSDTELSLVITGQEIPAGGYPQPELGFFTRWGVELFITCLYTLGGVGMLIGAVRKKSRFLLLVPGFFLVVAGIVFHNNGLMRSYMLLVSGILILAVGVYYYFRSPIPKLHDRSSPS